MSTLKYCSTRTEHVEGKEGPTLCHNAVQMSSYKNGNGMKYMGSSGSTCELTGTHWKLQ